MTADRAWHVTLDCGCQVNPESGAMLQECERHSSGQWNGYAPGAVQAAARRDGASLEQHVRTALAELESCSHALCSSGDVLAEGRMAGMLRGLLTAAAPQDNGPGTLEVGAKDGQVVVNLPRDMTGHIVFSVQQAHDFAHTVVRKALEAQGAPEHAADLHVSFPDGPQTVCPACVLGNDPPVRVRLCADHAAMMGPRLDPTNHHSALTCPYCNPHQLRLRPRTRLQVPPVRQPADMDAARKAMGLPDLVPLGGGLHQVGGHVYDEQGTSDCANGCGCWAGPSRSGGPDGVDPLGACPKAGAARKGG